VLLEGALFLYSIIQYSWKAVQWLVITPLALFLLLIMGLVKLLVSLVPFLRSSVVASFSTFFSYVMMHWVAEVQVYLLDYTRSSAVRGRFDKEFKHFFDDAKCDRIVVIAESGGTMVAYEGLTTLLEPWKNPKKSWPKPVTFITVSQALRRVWLLDIDDSGRLHGVLPKGVRWVNFWARYDPIAAGPLPARSLPPRQRARTKEAGDSDADKERITNVAVHNTDNTFTDHTGYWDNLEQVIAVIALELVQGHPTLVEVVEKHQATGDDILLRRASVAWRAMVTLFGGLAAGSGIIAWNLTHNYDISIVIKKCFQPKGACSVLLGDLFTGQPVSPLLSLSTSFLQNPVGVVIGFFEGLGTLLTRHLDVVIMIVSALVVAGGVMLLLAQVIAAPSPFNFKARTASRGGPQLVLALAVVALACFIVAFLLPTDLQPARLYLPGAGSHMLTEVGVLVTAGAWILALLDALRIRRWGWLVAIVAISLLGGITGIGVGGLFLLCILGSVLLYGLTAGGG
jgi:hypothetical protein